MSKIYFYNPETKEFIIEGIADESPLEPGVFLIPAFATEYPPPVVGVGQLAKFINSKWVLQDIQQPILVPTPTMAEIKKEKFSSINATYATKLSQISDAIQQAIARGDNVTVTKLQVTYASTNAEWKAKLNAVK